MNDKGKDVNYDWLADQWDERSVLGHARVNKGRMKGNDPQIDTAQNPKRFDWRLALQGKIQKIFADSIPNNLTDFIYISSSIDMNNIPVCVLHNVSLLRGPLHETRHETHAFISGAGLSYCSIYMMSRRYEISVSGRLHGKSCRGE